MIKIRLLSFINVLKYINYCKIAIYFFSIDYESKANKVGFG